MRNSKTKIIATLMTVIMATLSLGMTVSATEYVPYEQEVTASSITPRYSIALTASSYLSISSGTANCTSTAMGETDTVKISCTQTLEKKSVIGVYYSVSGASWTATVNLRKITVSNTKSNLDSGTYRLKSVYTLTKTNGESETITVYSSEKTV